MKRLLIVGTGKLGQRYYQHLTQASSTQNPIEITTLSRSEKSWSKHHIALDISQPIDPECAKQLPLFDTIVFILAPGKRDEALYRATYLDAPRHLLSALDTNNSPHIIWVSSTSVYGEQSQRLTNESTIPRPANVFSQILLDAEQAVIQQSARASILRPAGLYSSQRQRLLDSLLNSEQYDNPKWLNLVHEDDVCRHIEFLRQSKQPLLIAADATPFQRAHLQDFIKHSCPESHLTKMAHTSKTSLRLIKSQQHDQLPFNYPSVFDWFIRKSTKTAL